MTSRLHGKLASPYYIYAPAYRETSSGVCVLHYLCHALNLSGHEAYVTGTDVVNPDLRTPVLDNVMLARHQGAGREPIMVYPEVVTGNPLGSQVVVRYLLNRDGFLTGKGVEFGEDDLIFYYAHDFRGRAGEENMLTLPVIDSELFSPPASPVKRSGAYLYQHRFPANQIDFSQLPDDVEVLSLANPKTLAELADVFKSAAVLYSYEVSATCTEAMLCGCPVIYLKGGSIETLPFTEHFGEAGAAMCDEPGGLERARATVLEARQRWLEIETTFWPQLERFIALTQKAVSDHAENRERRMLGNWLKARRLTAVQHRLVEQYRQAQTAQPRLAVLVRDLHGNATAMQSTLDSLAIWRNQSPTLQQVVLSILPPPPELSPDVEWLACQANLAGQLNGLIQKAGFDWFVLLEAGDQIIESGALMIDLELPAAQSCQMIYCDEVHRSGEEQGLALRPGFNLDYLLSFPLGMARHWLFQRERVIAAAGFDADSEQALEFDLILRMIEVNGMDGIGHIDEPLLICNAPVLQDNPHELKTLRRHLQVRGYERHQISQPLPRHYHVQYGHAEQPLVSIILTCHEQLAELQRCLQSILEKTAYRRFEVLIVDNDSQSPEALEWLAGVDALDSEQIRVLRHGGRYNRAAMLNRAATVARGEYLMLLDSNTAAVREDWLSEMLNHGQRPEVGIVGGRLVNPQGKVEQAGLILGLQGAASCPFAGRPMNSPGYMQRLLLEQNFSAVSGDCLLIRKALFEQAGGFDEAVFQVSGHDVDLCLKTANLGYLTVWTPHAVLLQDPATADRASGLAPAALQAQREQERDALYARWLPNLASDPAYNRNLSLSGNGFDLERNPELSWRPLSWRPLPVVLGCPLEGQWPRAERLMEPAGRLRDAGYIDALQSSRLLSLVDVQRFNPDVLVMQGALEPERMKLMASVQACTGIFKVAELDIRLPGLHGDGITAEGLEKLRAGLALVDRVVVGSPSLAEALRDLHGDIRVVQSRLPADPWLGLKPVRQAAAKPRLGWILQPDHEFDLALLLEITRSLADEVQWTMIGECPAAVRPWIEDLRNRVDDHLLPGALGALNLDLALVPLGSNLINRCRDNLHLLQLGACGYPVVTSDVGCHVDGLPLTRVDNSLEPWLEAIRAHLADLPATAARGDQLRRCVREHWMADQAYLDQWRAAWLPD
ncbi:glycosyltransferase [Pseudomonas sp. LS1212]|uniref:glycosyltransferase n=1 Tax=Pseudomonas sp. LS1212 TaxID=2972478 RepID=UPI00215B7FD4|nr:glycosyltransferase [Pseudomonas sp. LS1212]UVJ45424.1 glycosyltransferase [Pseudomonas sp. LS1212]